MPQTVDDDPEKLWEGRLVRTIPWRGRSWQDLIEEHVPDKVHLRFPRSRFRQICLLVFVCIGFLDGKDVRSGRLRVRDASRPPGEYCTFNIRAIVLRFAVLSKSGFLNVGESSFFQSREGVQVCIG